MYRRTMAIQQKLGNKQFEARTMGGLGQVLREKGDVGEASALFQQARELFDEIGDNRGRAVQVAFLGDTYMDIENFNAAEEAYRQAVQLFTKVSDLEAVAAVKVGLGRALTCLIGHPMMLYSSGQQALELYRELQQDDKVELVEELLRNGIRG